MGDALSLARELDRLLGQPLHAAPCHLGLLAERALGLPRADQGHAAADGGPRMKLQSVELRVEDVAKTSRFFQDVWGLTPVDGGAKLRGSAGLPYLVALEQGTPSIRSI